VVVEEEAEGVSRVARLAAAAVVVVVVAEASTEEVVRAVELLATAVAKVEGQIGTEVHNQNSLDQHHKRRSRLLIHHRRTAHY
jgi:hypothetical protein